MGYDLGLKASLYAGAGIPALWVVDLAGRGVHGLSGPSEGGYQRTTLATAGSTLAVEGLGGASVAVGDILGPD